MKCLILRRRWIVPSLLLSPLILWIFVVVVAPTDWARRRLTNELELATGQRVAIDRVSLGLMGRLSISGLSLATLSTPDDPWLKAASASLDVHLLQILGGCCRPTDVELAGVEARVLRRADGTLEIEDLLRTPPRRTSGSFVDSGSDFHPTVTFLLKDSSLVLVDDPAATRFEVTSLNGRATWSEHAVSVDELAGFLNGGTFEFAAKLSRGAGEPVYDAEARIRGVTLGSGLNELSYLVPVAAGASETIDGRLNLRLTVHGQGFTKENVRRTLKGYGAVVMDPINLDGSQLLREVEAFGRLPRSERVGTVRTNFTIADGKVSSEDLTVKLAGVPLVLTGWTDFDGAIDYRTRPDLMTGRVAKELRNVLGEFKIDGAKLAAIRIDGSLNQARVTLDHGDVADAAKQLLKDKEKSRELKNRILDKVLR